MTVNLQFIIIVQVISGIITVAILINIHSAFHVHCPHPQEELLNTLGHTKIKLAERSRHKT